jgi:hypothetical protein
MVTVLQDDDIKVPTRYHPIFIHNVFGHFFHDTLEYFSSYLYPRFEWRTVSTYDKAVEYIERQKTLGREPDMPMKPAFILNPSGDFNFDESGHGARQPWRFINLSPGLTTRLYQPIYQDKNLEIVPGFQRYKGEMEFLALCTSFYEYTDLRVYLLQMFTGTDRYIYPRFFNSFIILPQQLLDYRYTSVDGTSYTIAEVIESAGAQCQLVKTIDKDMMVFPCTIHPRMKLVGITEASTRLGGLDKLADWRLTFNVEYEIEIPTFLVLISDYLAENINFQIMYESCYTENDLTEMKKPPEYIHQISTRWNVTIAGDKDVCGEKDTSSEGGIHVILPDKAEIVQKRQVVETTRYYYVVDSTTDLSIDIVINLPEVITDPKLLLLYSKYGVLPYGDCYQINQAGTELTVYTKNVILLPGDILELYVYKIMGVIRP